MTTLQAKIVIEKHRGPKTYNRFIFGQFLEHFHRQVYGGVFEPGSSLSDEQGFRLDVVEALRSLKIPVVRWPGGCYVSAYHWKDGVGPNRRPTYDKAWRVEDPNTFGTDEFVAWCRLIGAEPYICTNAGSGSPEEMSDWVEYCNLPSQGYWARQRVSYGCTLPHNVRFWSIGNENYGGWEMGAKTTAEWGPFVAESAKMMRRVDPGIRLLAAALPDADWTLNLLKHAGKHLDYASIHGYWDPLWQKDEPSDYMACIRRSLEPEKQIRLTEQIIGVACYEGKIGIAFDEWNLRGWHHPDGNTPQVIQARDRNDRNATYTMADAVFSAGFLNTCLRHAETVQMANMAPVVNTRGPLYVHANGIVKRTTFHVLWLYANLLKDQLLDTWVSTEPIFPLGADIPMLDAITSWDAPSDTLTLAIINRHAEQEITCEISLDGTPVGGVHAGMVLSGASPDDFNDVSCPDRVVPQETQFNFQDGRTTLPAHSVILLSISQS